MIKFKDLFIAFLIFSLLPACGTQKPQQSYLVSYPPDSEKIKSFYLLGDGGHGDASQTMEALKVLLASTGSTEDHILFLGDNISAKQLLREDPQDRNKAIAKLDKQVQDTSQQVIFIPGELDWDEQGMEGLKEQEKYLQEKMNSEDAFMPLAGCPLQFVDLSDEVHLIILDSQWFLNDWDDHPTINDDCEEVKTREAMFMEVESELKKNQNKTTVIALHHPLYSNGVHGGNFYLTPYLQPSKEKINIPFIGPLAMLLRTSGGFSSQDVQNERYKELAARLETISHKWGRVIFASGHEHSLQYIENEGVKQIIAGSASTNSYAGLRKNGLFSSAAPGFAVFEVFQNGSSWINFYGRKENHPVLLYRKQVFPKREEYPVDTLRTDFPVTVTTSAYQNNKKEIGGFNRTIWGEGHRQLYIEELEVPTADLDTLYGGLEAMRMGGGNQTSSLRVKDSLDREYNFRKIIKDPLQFIQAGLYRDKPISGLFEGTSLVKLTRGFFTAAHPYGFLAVPDLAEAVGVLHTNPELYYMPKQPELGIYNLEHGDDLYMIEERPEEHWLGYESFGSPNHDIESTQGLFERLRRDETYSLDEPAYVRARIFDMLIGDWDRHNDQWRWSEIELENGNRIFKPVPRDRDQAFANFDGLLFDLLRATVGVTKRFPTYDEEIADLEQFNTAAMPLDRALLQNVGKETWISEAQYIQNNLSDEEIEEAFSRLPKEIQGTSTADLMDKIKIRRKKIINFAEQYYEELAEAAVMTGTDKDEFIDVFRLGNGKTRVRITRNKDGERDEVVAEKIFNSEETEEILIYGLDDSDHFTVQGTGSPEILVRLIGGQDEDIFNIENGDAVKVYDFESEPNRIEQKNGAKVLLTDDFEVNFYDHNRRFPSGLLPSPTLRYNPDEGAVIGLRGMFTSGNLVEFPFNQKHLLIARYFSATRGYDVKYEGEIRNFKGDHNYYLGAYYSSPRHTQNFFGFGNDTENRDEELTWDYNRIRISKIKGEVGLVKKGPYGHHLKYLATFEGVQVEENALLTNEFDLDPEYYHRKYFAGLEGNYQYESYDTNLRPTSGLNVELIAGAKMNVESEEAYLYLEPHLELFNALTTNRKLVLNTRIQGQVNFGDNYEFYQAATVGGDNGLRGFRNDRFVGQQAFAAGGDLIYHFNTVKTPLLPFQLSFFGGYDIGRVWYNERESNTWHQSYGGGLRANLAEAVGAKFNLYKSVEGWRFTFGFGVRF